MSEIYAQMDFGNRVHDYKYISETLKKPEKLSQTEEKGVCVYHDNGFGLVISDRSPEIIQDNLEILFDGSLDNGEELCTTLGIHMPGVSEEVVVKAAYAHWGKDCGYYLKGDYACAITDRKANQSFLIRAPFGLKALYYYLDENTLVVASSHQKYIATGVLPVKINFEYIAEYFAGYDSASRRITPYIHWNSLLPGETLLVQNGNAQRISIWKPARKRHTLSERDTIECFRQLFIDSVYKKIHLKKYPHYVFNLSGGLDSSAIVCALSCIPQFDQSRLSVYHDCHVNDMDDEEVEELGVSEERELAEKVCEKLGVSLNLRTIHDENMLLRNYEPLRDFAEPTVDILSGFPSSVYSLKKNYPTITGFGGDQVLFRNVHLNRKNYKQQQMNSMRFYKIYREILHPEYIEKYSLDERAAQKQEERIFDTVSQNDQWEKIFRCDQWVGNQDSYRSTRVLPYLDRDLIEYSLNLPDKYYIRKGYNKYILRKAFEKELPPEIFCRHGKGNHVSTVYDAIREGWDGIEKRYDNLYLVRYGIADKEKLLNRLQNFKYGVEPHMIHIMRILALELWLESKQSILP